MRHVHLWRRVHPPHRRVILHPPQRALVVQHPAAIEITRKTGGEEGFVTVWVVDFEKGGPRLVEWRETGRKTPDKIYHYGKGLAVIPVE